MRVLALLVVIGSLAAPGYAQDAQPAAEPETPIDATKLGVSLSRIQRGLFIAESRDKKDGDAVRLQFNVQVYGRAPTIEVLKGVDLSNGAVPGTSPLNRSRSFSTSIFGAVP